MTNFMTPLEAQLSLGLALLIGLAIGSVDASARAATGKKPLAVIEHD